MNARVTAKTQVNLLPGDKNMNNKVISVIAFASSAAILIGVLAKNQNSEQTSTTTTDLSTQTAIMTEDTGINQTSAHKVPNTTNLRFGNLKTNKNITDVLKKRYAAVSDNPQYPSIEERVAALEKMYPDQTIDAEQVIDTLSQPTAWKNSSTEGKGLPLTQAEMTDGREFIEFDRERVAVMLPGDKIELPIKDLGGAVKVVIDSIKDEGDKTLTWNGHLEGVNEFMRVTLTQGVGISVGLIETENATYNLQSSDSKGWIASTKVLMKHDPADGLIDEHDHSATDHHHD
jgi:hypothetical protein